MRSCVPSECMPTMSHSMLASASVNTGIWCSPSVQLPLVKRVGPWGALRMLEITSRCSSPSTLATKPPLCSYFVRMEEFWCAKEAHYRWICRDRGQAGHDQSHHLVAAAAGHGADAGRKRAHARIPGGHALRGKSSTSLRKAAQAFASPPAVLLSSDLCAVCSGFVLRRRFKGIRAAS